MEMAFISRIVYMLFMCWKIEAAVEKQRGHYPDSYCTFDDVILRTAERQFYYHSDTDLHSQCGSINNMWSLNNDATLLHTNCTEKFDVAHIFTIYYYYGSNYYHLHYDFLIPLYAAIYHEADGSADTVSTVFMPSTETSRLQKINWETPAFVDPSKYWMQMTTTIVGQNSLIPLDSQIEDHGETICFKKAHFGIPRTNFADRNLIRGFVKYIQQSLNITVNTNVQPRIAVISRAGRRKIVNEAEIIDALRTLGPVDRIDFAGMTFRDQVALMQRYAVLVGMIGAGLINGLYLPPGGVVVQLVPSGMDVNNREFAELLRGGGGGGFIEWMNKHESNAMSKTGDTVVDVSELLEVTREALEMFQHSKQRFEL